MAMTDVRNKRPPFQPKCLGKGDFARAHEGMESTHRLEVCLVFILTWVVTVSFPQWLGSDLTVLI